MTESNASVGVDMDVDSSPQVEQALCEEEGVLIGTEKSVT